MTGFAVFAIGMFTGGIVGFAVARCCMTADRSDNDDDGQ